MPHPDSRIPPRHKLPLLLQLGVDRLLQQRPVLHLPGIGNQRVGLGVGGLKVGAGEMGGPLIATPPRLPGKPQGGWWRGGTRLAPGYRRGIAG